MISISHLFVCIYFINELLNKLYSRVEIAILCGSIKLLMRVYLKSGKMNFLAKWISVQSKFQEIYVIKFKFEIHDNTSCFSNFEISMLVCCNISIPSSV